MYARLGAALLGLTLALGAATVHAQAWPSYGEYGYGTGFDYTRNPYSYPRPIQATSDSLPNDTLSLYGGYMPHAYYAGAAYNLDRGIVFPSGQAYCQSSGSYLYCADIASGGAVLLSLRGESGNALAIGRYRGTHESPASFSGFLATRTQEGTTYLQGSLASASGQEVPVSCAGPLRGEVVSLACQRTPVTTGSR
jgi:hypothetical protein